MSSPPVKHLVLDAGPLLSLTPLRGLSENYYTVPQVIGELRDKRGKEYLERLALTGVSVKIQSPDVSSVAQGSFTELRLA
jgi:RNA-binding protein NOB1